MISACYSDSLTVPSLLCPRSCPQGYNHGEPPRGEAERCTQPADPAEGPGDLRSEGEQEGRHAQENDRVLNFYWPIVGGTNRQDCQGDLLESKDTKDYYMFCKGWVLCG